MSSYISMHTKGMKAPRIEASLFDDSDFQGVDELEQAPITLIVGPCMLSLTIKDANKMACELNRVLGDAERSGLYSWDGRMS